MQRFSYSCRWGKVGKSLSCKTCQLKYPVRDGIPVMLVDEAIDTRSGKQAEEFRGGVAAFKVIDGPNKGLSFHIDCMTCKAIGRSIADPNKTTIFNIDVSLALDEGTKGLIQHYLSRQFKDQKATNNEVMGSFKRTGDVILDDMSISRLHAMFFYGEAGVGVLDMVSKNGTFVNGEEIESCLLKKGDAIEIGETKIIFEG
ncbi:MAG: FHA domain-containing protein [Deltaproteobacteria bacterium]|nr:FHA domain-containing protein [Deltaproteobacteria bacterium]